MKPTLKAPGSKRLLTLKYDELLSNFGFNFNLRRYTKDYQLVLHKVGSKLNR